MSVPATRRVYAHGPGRCKGRMSGVADVGPDAYARVGTNVGGCSSGRRCFLGTAVRRAGGRLPAPDGTPPPGVGSASPSARLAHDDPRPGSHPGPARRVEAPAIGSRGQRGRFRLEHYAPADERGRRMAPQTVHPRTVTPVSGVRDESMAEPALTSVCTVNRAHGRQYKAVSSGWFTRVGCSLSASRAASTGDRHRAQSSPRRRTIGRLGIRVVA